MKFLVGRREGSAEFKSPSPRRAWIEIVARWTIIACRYVALPTEGVD